MDQIWSKNQENVHRKIMRKKIFYQQKVHLVKKQYEIYN